MTHDLKVILKYSGGSSYGLLALILGCPWKWYWSLRWRSWVCLGASVGGLGPLLWPLRVVLAGLGSPGAAQNGQERPQSTPKSRQERPRAPQERPRATQERPRTA